MRRRRFDTTTLDTRPDPIHVIAEDPLSQGATHGRDAPPVIQAPPAVTA